MKVIIAEKVSLIYANIHTLLYIIVLEFEEFKVKEQEKQQCLFVKARAKTDFYCHRSGPSRSRSTGKRLQKSQESNKIGYTCPAHIKLVERDDGTAHIFYQKVHLGHQDNLGRLNLSKQDRTVLAGKILQSEV